MDPHSTFEFKHFLKATSTLQQATKLTDQPYSEIFHLNLVVFTVLAVPEKKCTKLSDL